MLLLFLPAIQAAGLVVAAAFGLALPFSSVLERAALRGCRPAGGSVATVLTCAAGMLLGLGVAHATSVTGQDFQATLAGNPEASPTDFTWVYPTFMTTLVRLGLSRWSTGACCACTP